MRNWRCKWCMRRPADHVETTASPLACVRAGIAMSLRSSYDWRLGRWKMAGCLLERARPSIGRRSFSVTDPSAVPIRKSWIDRMVPEGEGGLLSGRQVAETERSMEL